MRVATVIGVVAGSVVLAACGSSTGGSAGDESRPKPTGKARELELTVEDGNPVGGPKSFKVTQGERVRITLKPDGTLRAHLHGYDILEKGSEDDPPVIDFMAEDAGVFELEDGGELLANVSVYPK